MTHFINVQRQFHLTHKPIVNYYAQVLWQLFCQAQFQKEEIHIFAGDETVIGKPEKKTFGVDLFFSGLQQKVIPSLSFFVLSLVNVKQRHSYKAQLLHADFPTPLNVVIIVKTNLSTQAWGHVILFSSDLELSADLLVEYYRLRF